MYLTVFGIVVVTFKVPVFVKTLAIPNSELLPSLNVFPELIVTLNKLAVPDSVFPVPVNTDVPAV